MAGGVEDGAGDGLHPAPAPIPGPQAELHRHRLAAAAAQAPADLGQPLPIVGVHQDVGRAGAGGVRTQAEELLGRVAQQALHRWADEAGRAVEVEDRDHVVGVVDDELVALLDRPQFPAQPLLAQHPLDNPRQHRQGLATLDQVVSGAPLHHLHGHVLIATAGDHHHGDVPLLLPQPVEQLAGMAVGQVIVDHHQVRRPRLQPLDGVGQVVDGHRRQAGPPQPPGLQVGEAGVVLDDQNQ